MDRVDGDVAAALQARGLSVAFGGNRVLDDVSADVAPGELVGLIGPNGAGKTTLIDAVTGFVPASGTVEVGGVRIDRLPPHRRATAGVARTWQSVELFDDLTVIENLTIGQGRQRWFDAAADMVGFGQRAARAAGCDAARAALAALGVSEIADASPDTLSPGIRKTVGVARALATGAGLLLLDEPAAGLDDAESAALGERLRALVANDLSILLVDHDMHLVLSVCDRIHVLERGRLIASGPPDRVRADPAVVAAYFGASA